MKITFFLLLAFFVQVSASTYSQQVKVSLECQNEELLTVMKNLEKQTDLFFFFNDKAMDTRQKVTLSVKEEKLDEVLDKLFAGRFQWEIVSNQIVLNPVPRQMPRQQEMYGVVGRVTDENGLPLPGVTVLLKGTQLGTATDADGVYMLMIPDGKNVLLFTMVGMETQERSVQPDGKEIRLDVTMKNAVSEMKEVVVTGYFNKSKDSFTGAVTSVKREELRKFGNVNLLEALRMVDPSFKIKENNLKGSDPNTLPDFFVRGESSFMGESNIPTFIVDGYEVSLQRVFDMDMERIESITVLKDASATILYGSRAANGVVVIETRRPEGGRFQVTYSNRTSLSMADLTDYNLMDAREKLEYEQKSGIFDGLALEGLRHLEKIKADVERGVNTDWLAQPVRNAVSHAHSLYIDGGSEAVIYGLGVNYNRNNGVIKKSYREVFGASFDLTYRIRDKINVRNSFEFTQTNVKNSPYGSFSLYAKANPYNPIYDEDGKLIKTYTVHANQSETDDQYQNPLYNATLPYKDESAIHTITDNLSIDYWILPELRFKGTVALTKTLNSSDKFVSPDHTDYNSGYKPTEKGYYKKGNGKGFSYNINTTLNYNLQKNRHLLFTGVGMNLIQNKSVNDSYKAIGFLDGRFNEIWFGSSYENGGKPSGSEEEDRMIGLFANVNYSIANRYLLDLSARLDGSSMYGSESKFSPFWAVGLGWNIHHEKFMENTGISRLKIRGSIGTTGKASFQPYQSQTMFEYIQDGWYATGIGATLMALGNPNLKWETTTAYDLGLDFGMWEDRLTVTFGYYLKKTKNLLSSVTLPTSLGFIDYKENLGQMENEGVELALRSFVYKSNDWNVSLFVNMAHNKNRIVSISNALSSYNDKADQEQANNDDYKTKPMVRYKEGRSSTAIYAMKSLGIDPATGKELFQRQDGTNTYVWDPNESVVCGDSEPKVTGAFGTNITWKQLNLNMNFSYRLGGQVYNQTLINRVENADPRDNVDRRVLEQRWQKPGDHTFYKDINDKSTTPASSRFIQDENVLQLGSLSLSYDLKKEWVK